MNHYNQSNKKNYLHRVTTQIRSDYSYFYILTNRFPSLFEFSVRNCHVKVISTICKKKNLHTVITKNLFIMIQECTSRQIFGTVQNIHCINMQKKNIHSADNHIQFYFMNKKPNKHPTTISLNNAKHGHKHTQIRR